MADMNKWMQGYQGSLLDQQKAQQEARLNGNSGNKYPSWNNEFNAFRANNVNNGTSVTSNSAVQGQQSQQDQNANNQQANPYANRDEAQQAINNQAQQGVGGQGQQAQVQTNTFAQDKNSNYNAGNNVQAKDPLQRTTDDPHKASYWNGNNAFNQKARENAFGIDPDTGEAVTDEKAARLGGKATGVNIDKGDNEIGTKAWRDSITKSKNEEAEAKENRRRLALLALADATRHIGNLYYTTKGATPQQFNSPVVDEYNRQEQERKEKSAAELARQQREDKLREAQRKQDNADREYAIKLGKDNRDQDTWEYNRSLRPYDSMKRKNDALGSAVDTDIKIKTQGDRIKESASKAAEADANAKTAGAKSKYAEKKEKAELDGIYARNENTKTSTRKINYDISKGEKERRTRYTVNGKHYDVLNERVKDVNTQLLKYADDNMPVSTDGKTYSATEKIAWAKAQNNSAVDKIMQDAVGGDLYYLDK